MISKVKIALIVLIGLLLGNNIRLQKKVNTLDEQVATALNNTQTWIDIANERTDKSRVLQLTLDDFKHANDSLIKLSKDQQKKLKIKDNQLRQVTSTETIIRDTITEVIPSKNKDFSVELKPNQLTTIKVARKDSILSHTMEILNHQDLFVYEQKTYRRQYKNWFIRLLHFDFKKDKISKYQIINSNDLIQVIDTRVINISE